MKHRAASKAPKMAPPSKTLANPGADRTRETNPRHLLDRILDTPHLAHVVSQLQPELLHRVVQHCGLEECGDLLTLTTPDQFARILDLDLWRSARSGGEEQLDADRFGVWLEVLVESGAAAAARKLAEMDVDLIAAGIAHHARVFDRVAVTPYTTLDGEEIAPIDGVEAELVRDVGGYVFVAKRTCSWDAIAAALMALSAEHPHHFDEVMRECLALSNSIPERDGLHELLDAGDQVMLEAALERERRRERDGYVSPPQARAFLQMSRELRLDSATVPSVSPIARAYLGDIDELHTAQASAARNGEAQPVAPGQPEDYSEAVAAVVDLLAEAGVLPRQPRALLRSPHEQASRGQAPRLERIHAHMESLLARDCGAHSRRTAELAFLANALLAGCSIQSRPFTEQEASDAAVAVCNLGLENWPARWLSDDDRGRLDFVSAFQVGWTVLHDDVCVHAASRLIEVLGQVRCGDREIQHGLDALRIDLTRHTRTGAPWRARDAMDVLAILDMPAWATLLALIDGCPSIHAGMAASRDSRTHAVSASAFEFISGNNQIAAVHEYLQRLPEILGG